MEKKFLVLSDSHRLLTHTIAVLNKLTPHIDGIIHLGDNTQDANSISKMYPDIELFTVAGNCDYDGDEEYIMHVGTKKILLTHGHKFHVKFSVDRLVYAALDREVDVALFGHTHTAGIMFEDGIYVMNPGSISLPRGGNYPTYGIMDISDDNINLSVVEVIGKDDFRVIL